MSMQQFSAYGILTNLRQKGNITTLYINHELYNCERNSSSIIISAIVRGDLIIGEKYLFTFSRLNENYEWNADISEKIDYCAYFHNKDLTIDHMGELEQETDKLTRIQPMIIPINHPTAISIELVNNQDISIKYKLLDFFIVDELVAQPFSNWGEKPYEERLEDSKISECKIDYNKEVQIIPATSRQTLTFTITCSEPINCKKSYESCDKLGNNCRMVNLDKCRFYLYGQITFEDELGFSHVMPDKGIVKQHLNIQ